MNRTRRWVAVCRYSYMPSFMADVSVFAETDEEARRLFPDKLSKIFPFIPEIVSVHPGAIFFVGDKDE